MKNIKNLIQLISIAVLFLSSQNILLAQIDDRDWNEAVKGLESMGYSMDAVMNMDPESAEWIDFNDILSMTGEGMRILNTIRTERQRRQLAQKMTDEIDAESYTDEECEDEDCMPIDLDTAAVRKVRNEQRR